MAVVNQTLALMEAHAQRVAITSGNNTPVLVHEITRERDVRYSIRESNRANPI